MLSIHSGSSSAFWCYLAALLSLLPALAYGQASKTSQISSATKALSTLGSATASPFCTSYIGRKPVVRVHACFPARFARRLTLVPADCNRPHHRSLHTRRSDNVGNSYQSALMPSLTELTFRIALRSPSPLRSRAGQCEVSCLLALSGIHAAKGPLPMTIQDRSRHHYGDHDVRLRRYLADCERAMKA